MADTHEEQLLSELLSSIARADARLEAPHLESRVMAAVDATSTVRPKMVRLRADPNYVVAAALAMAVLVPAVVFITRDVPARTAEVTAEPVERGITHPPRTVGDSSVPARPPKPTRLTQRRIPTARTRPTNRTQPAIADSPIAQSPIEFVPLMPMTEQELTGPFQLVRVQMPRSSLGALRSPLEHPNELVEADVLLGEDGMARAIRVSSSGSVYPWRSR